MVMQAAVNIFGSVAVAGFTAASKVNNLLTQGLISIGQTMASYVGQNFGSGNLDRIKKGIFDAFCTAAVYAIVMGGAGVILLPHLIQLFFSSDIAVADLMVWAKPYFYACVACYIPLGMIFIYRNSMQGCGYGLTAMMLGIMELFARLVMAGTSIFLHNYIFAALADPFAWLMTGVFAWILYHFVLRDVEKKWGD